MGYNTTINILNDALDQIQKHPEQFVQGILSKYYKGGNVGVGNHANPVRVMRSGHADEFRLYAVHGNSMTELSPYSRETRELIENRPFVRDVFRGSIREARWLLDQLESHLNDIEKSEGDE